MTIVYNPPEEHECSPPNSSGNELRVGAIWKCECGDLFELLWPSSDLSYALWTRLNRLWHWSTYRKFKNK